MAVEGRALRFEYHHAKQHAGGLIAILLTRKVQTAAGAAAH